MRTAGLSMMRLLGYLMRLAAVLAVAQFVLSDRVLPPAENGLTEWWSASAPADDTPTKRWAHTSGGTVSMERISPDGRRLIDVRLYVRDAKGLIQDFILPTIGRTPLPDRPTTTPAPATRRRKPRKTAT